MSDHPKRPFDLWELKLEVIEFELRHTRQRRTARIRELHSCLPLPCDVWGGHQSSRCLREIVRCYLYEFDQAVVLLCLAYIERELAAILHDRGWRGSTRAKLQSLLDRGLEEKLVTVQEANVYLRLARIRRSYAHFKGSQGPTVPKMEEYAAPPAAEMAKDATQAIRTLALFILRRWLVEKGQIVFYPATS